jgi:hypothetical protein
MLLRPPNSSIPSSPALFPLKPSIILARQQILKLQSRRRELSYPWPIERGSKL